MLQNKLCLVLLAACFCCCSWALPQSRPVTTSTTPASTFGRRPSHDHSVYFVVSASGLHGEEADTDGEADPFVKVFLGTEPLPVGGVNANGTEEELMQLGTSETLAGNNPKWNTVFKVDHYPRSKQLLYLEVRDHDPVNLDDVIGDVYINLDDFVLAGTKTSVLEKAKSGSITVTRTSPIYLDLLLQNIPPSDWWDGLSDIYVKSYFRVGQEGTDYKFNQTHVIEDAETASFERIPFENYQRGTNQVLHFRVKDEDPMSKDDDLGEAFLNVDSFLQGNRPTTFNLQRGGKLTVTLSRD